MEIEAAEKARRASMRQLNLESSFLRGAMVLRIDTGNKTV